GATEPRQRRPPEAPRQANAPVLYDQACHIRSPRMRAAKESSPCTLSKHSQPLTAMRARLTVSVRLTTTILMCSDGGPLLPFHSPSPRVSTCDFYLCEVDLPIGHWRPASRLVSGCRSG